ncbi:hypothetical protein ACJX0J_014648, partial [Zea mays]
PYATLLTSKQVKNVATRMHRNYFIPYSINNRETNRGAISLKAFTAVCFYQSTPNFVDTTPFLIHLEETTETLRHYFRIYLNLFYFFKIRGQIEPFGFRKIWKKNTYRYRLKNNSFLAPRRKHNQDRYERSL